MAQPVNDFPLYVQRTLAKAESFSWSAEQDVEPAGRVQRTGLPSRASGNPEQFNGLLSMPKRFPVATLTVEHPRPDSVRVCLARLVAEHLVKLESLPHLLIGRVMTVEAAVGAQRDRYG